MSDYFYPTLRSRSGFFILMTVILSAPFGLFLICAYFARHPELNPKWVEPWSIQIVEHDEYLFLFIQVNRMVRLRGPLISSSVRPTERFDYLIKISNRDEIRLFGLDLEDEDIRISPSESKIFSVSGCIYMYSCGHLGSSSKLYEFRDCKFNTLPNSRASEVLVPGAAPFHGSSPGNLLSLYHHEWHKGIFKWRNSKFTVKKVNGIIQMTRCPLVGDLDKSYHVNQKLKFPNGGVFQYVIREPWVTGK